MHATAAPPRTLRLDTLQTGPLNQFNFQSQVFNYGLMYIKVIPLPHLKVVPSDELLFSQGTKDWPEPKICERFHTWSWGVYCPIGY